MDRFLSRFDYGHASVIVTLCKLVVGMVVHDFWSILLPLTCTGWQDSIVYCKLERPWPDIGASPRERS